MVFLAAPALLPSFGLVIIAPLVPNTSQGLCLSFPLASELRLALQASALSPRGANLLFFKPQFVPY